MSVTVIRAAPYLTVQDFGRTNFRVAGVPRCGAMDRAALGAVNAVIGNDIESAGFEWALGGGSLRFNESCLFSLGGAAAAATAGGKEIPPFTATRAGPGDVLDIGRFHSGRFLYIALEGGVATEPLLGSRSTYLPAHFGGLDGQIIRSGANVPRGSGRGAVKAGFSAPTELRPHYSRDTIRVIPGPQWTRFTESDKELFFGQRYTVARSADRTGYRLEGKPLSASLGLLPSEVVCEGTIQIPPNGLPIVLMADSPTVGGYLKIGVVETSDLSLLAQMNTGDGFQFEQVSIEDAQRRLRRAATSVLTLRSLALGS